MNNKTIEQFNITQIILYHFLPGIPILLISIILSNPSWGIGLPYVLSIFLSIMFGLIPIQLFILFITAKRQNRNIKEILSYTNKTPTIQIVLWIIVLLTFAMVIMIFQEQLNETFTNIFSWIPDWFRISIEPVNQSPEFMWPVIILGFIFNGILGPIVEELYFRGFLLPRMNRFGKAAPFINVTLFSLYHLFTPWENISRILSTLPLYYVVWYKKDIRIGMIVHCLGNIFGMIGTTAALLNF